MDALIQWLVHDDQKDLFEFLVALALNLVFLALSALLLWPLDKLALAWSMAKGYALLWIVIFVTAVLLHTFQQFFRMNIYDRANAYIGSALAVCCLLQFGWAAFAALSVQSFASGGSIWTGVILYLVGGLSCLSAFCRNLILPGAVYKLTSLPLALVSFLVFSLWPNVARLAFGWFFNFLSAGPTWEWIKTMDDKDIDLTDIPEITAEQLGQAILRVSGKPVSKGKVRVNMYLDSEVVEYFKAQAGSRGYQTLINETLKESMRGDKLEAIIRQVIREELTTAK